MFFDWIEHGLALLSLSQGSCHHGDSLRWGEIDYFLQIRQLNHDIVGNIREEIQDIYEKDERIVDTELVVVALMLAIGFGFVVEGTFPQNDDGCAPWCQLVDFIRDCYGFCAGMSLVCPFLSMMGFLECRRRLNVFMRLFNHYVFQILGRQNSEANRLAADPARMVERASQNAYGLTERNEAWRRFRFHPDKTITGLIRRAACCSRRNGTLAVNHLLQEEEQPPVEFKVPVEYFTAANEYHNWFDAWVIYWKKGATVFMLAGVFFNVLCSALLLGLYFSNQYPDQWAWLIYSGTLVISLVFALMLLVRGFQHGPRGGTRWAKHDMPAWATEEFLAGVRSS